MKSKILAALAKAGILFAAPNPASAYEKNMPVTIGEFGVNVEQAHFTDILSENGGYFLRTMKTGSRTDLDPHTTQALAVHFGNFEASMGLKIPLSPNNFASRFGGVATLGYHGNENLIHSTTVLDGQIWRNETASQHYLPGNKFRVGPVAVLEGHYGYIPKIFGGLCASAQISKKISANACAAISKDGDGHASVMINLNQAGH